MCMHVQEHKHTHALSRSLKPRFASMKGVKVKRPGALAARLACNMITGPLNYPITMTYLITQISKQKGFGPPP